MPEKAMGDLPRGEGPPGFRLDAVELYNWGTFHRAVWRFPMEGHNAPVIGEIGSGKSTLVDTITTLLFPQQRIIYNKAAGAERRERRSSTPARHVARRGGASPACPSARCRGRGP
jgi:uncharacterized protein YPO0396